MTEETYHYHDTVEPEHSAECFDLTRSELDATLSWEVDAFASWVLGNPAVGDAYMGGGNDVALVWRSG